MAVQQVDKVPLLREALDAARERSPESRPSGIVRTYDFLGEGESFRDAVLAGLSRPEKSITWRALFDAAGLELFDRVCAQPEYLAGRTEKNVLAANVGEIVEFIGGDCQYIDVGNHGLASAGILIEHLRPSLYVPLNASIATLEKNRSHFEHRFPWLNISALLGDFERPMHLPRFVGVPIRFKAIFLMGGAFARFMPDEVPALLASLRALVGPAGRVLVTVDQTADWQILQGAYNDQRGAMEAFNANALRHVNQECEGDFQIPRFQHVADFQPKKGWLEMGLESQYTQFARVAGRRFDFSPGERIRTAVHCTYGAEQFCSLAQKAGLKVEKSWSDTHNLFSVHAMIAQ
jgi:dimethylhistidine N-methyltransferase